MVKCECQMNCITVYTYTHHHTYIVKKLFRNTLNKILFHRIHIIYK